MSERTEVKTAVDAIRCLYVARTIERSGQRQAARRWYARVEEWMDRNGWKQQDKPNSNGEDRQQNP